MSFFPNAGASRPWPLKWGTARTGGSYVASGNGNSWGAGMAAGAVLLSYRWTNTDYDLVIWGVGAQIAVDTAFTSAQLACITTYKANSFTVMDTGGSDVTSVFAAPRTSSMPSISSFSGLEVRMASAGSTGLTAGTRTLTNPILSETVPTGTNAKAVTIPGIYRDISAAPIIVKANEGIVSTSVYALTGGTIVPQFVIDFDIVPAQISASIYG